MASLIAVTREFLDAHADRDGGAHHAAPRRRRRRCRSQNFLPTSRPRISDPHRVSEQPRWRILARHHATPRHGRLRAEHHACGSSSTKPARAMTPRAFAAGVTTMSPVGGQFLGLRTLCERQPAKRDNCVIDAAGLAMAASPIEVRTSREAALELATRAEQRSDRLCQAQLTSMFQTNCVALTRRTRSYCLSRP